jgi:hypothetical protein
VTDDKDKTGLAGDTDAMAPLHLRVVSGPVMLVEEPERAPPVRLRREFKGLTVADLHRDEVASRLPGQVRSALNDIERGDFDAAERALPGEFVSVLAGPGYHRRYRWREFAIVAVLAVLTGSAIASWLT